MNKKQLKISLVILGLFAIVVICAGLFSSTGGNKNNTEYGNEFLNTIEKLGDNTIDSISDFKDGLYKTQYSDNIARVEKNGDIVTIDYTGNSNIGRKDYIALIREVKKYSKTKLYTVSLIEYTGESGLSVLDRADSLDKLKEEIKSGKTDINEYNIVEDSLQLKVFDDSIMINDITYDYKGKIEKANLTAEEEEQLIKDWENNTKQYKYITDPDKVSDETDNTGDNTYETEGEQ